MFLTSFVALIYTLASKQRLVTVTNVAIFVLVTLSWGFMAALSIYDRGKRSEEPTKTFEVTCNMLYGLQFYPQWTSLFLFVVQYQSTEIEIRKVLNQKNIRDYTKPVRCFMPIFILLCVAATYFLCKTDGKTFYRSWVSAAAESVVCGILFAMHMRFVSKIYILIEEIDLDLAPVNTNFCGNITVVGFLFIITVFDALMHKFIYGSTADPTANDNKFFLVISISIQLSYFIAYMLLFRMIYNQTKKGRTFECLILHE